MCVNTVSMAPCSCGAKQCMALLCCAFFEKSMGLNIQLTAEKGSIQVDPLLGNTSHKKK